MANLRGGIGHPDRLGEAAEELRSAWMPRASDTLLCANAATCKSAIRIAPRAARTRPEVYAGSACETQNAPAAKQTQGGGESMRVETRPS